MEQMTFTKVVLVFFAMLICPPIWISFSLLLDIRLNYRDQNHNFSDKQSAVYQVYLHQPHVPSALVDHNRLDYHFVFTKMIIVLL